jgi:flagellar biosynthesis chaperone FliJ
MKNLQEVLDKLYQARHKLDSTINMPHEIGNGQSRRFHYAQDITDINNAIKKNDEAIKLLEVYDNASD